MVVAVRGSALLAVLALLLVAVVGAQSGSGSIVACGVDQYTDSETGECVSYANQGMKAGRDFDQELDSGNIAWMLGATALVMIMTPGVAFFYAGLAGEHMASNTIMMSFVSMALVSVQFWAFGYSAAFSSHGIFGWAGFTDVTQTPSGTYGSGIPHMLFALYQMQFAMIVPAELSGCVVGRMKFGTYLLFILLWTSIVYDPLARWIWSLKLDDKWEVVAMGWEGRMGALDFAGGTVIHVSAGFGALATALVVGRRYDHGEPVKPHNVPLVMIGATLLWFGWFGFNGGSQIAADGIAVVAALNTHLSASMGFLTWLGLEFAVHRKLDPCGAASGAVAGLVSITPGCAYVHSWAALIFGLVGAASAFAAVLVKDWLRYDDTLDVFAIHGCGGFMGLLLTGFFASSDVNPSIDGGAFYDNPIQLLHQLAAMCAAAAYTFVVTLLILFALKYTVGLRVSEEKEVNGIDISYHGGLAYDYSHHGSDRQELKPAGSQFKEMLTPAVEGSSNSDDNAVPAATHAPYREEL